MKKKEIIKLTKYLIKHKIGYSINYYSNIRAWQLGIYHYKKYRFIIQITKTTIKMSVYNDNIYFDAKVEDVEDIIAVLKEF